MERDVWFWVTHAEPTHFNSHAHVERDQKKMAEKLGLSHFNSHAHVERDYPARIIQGLERLISTHTLTWSVTSTGHGTIITNEFQLTRSRGA